MFRLPRWVPVAALALLIAGMFVGGSVKSTYAVSNYLNIPDIRQQETMWCWAATTQSIGRYLTGNNAVTQCNIVSNSYPGCPNWGSINTNNIKNALWASYRVSSNGVTWSSVSFATIKNEINANHPISIYWAWDNGSGHHLTINGYFEGGSAQNVNFHNPDPWNGGFSNAWYSWVVNGGSPHHSWQQTLTGIHP